MLIEAYFGDAAAQRRPAGPAGNQGGLADHDQIGDLDRPQPPLVIQAGQRAVPASRGWPLASALLRVLGFVRCPFLSVRRVATDSSAGR